MARKMQVKPSTEIFKMYASGKSYRVIAEEIDISVVTIRKIITGQIYPEILEQWIAEGNLPPNPGDRQCGHFTIPTETLLKFFKLHEIGVPNTRIAQDYGVSADYVGRVLSGKIRSDVFDGWKNG